MKAQLSVMTVAMAGLAVAAVVPSDLEISRQVARGEFLARRDLSPTDSYTPGLVTCPSTSIMRNASTISDNEASFIAGRREYVKPHLVDFLDRANLTDFNATEFLANATIDIGMAFSGGGYRAMLQGAGVLAAADSRTPNSTVNGGIGGLLQSSVYLAGLSGGNWLLGSVVINNFTTIRNLQGDPNVWDLEHSIFNPGGWKIWETVDYYSTLVDDVKGKEQAGFDISLTDYWGRALSNQFFNESDGGPELTFSNIKDLEAFKSYEMPFPMVVADGRPYNTKIVSLNSTVFEFNPFEMGSWDPTLFAMVDLQYLGSNLSAGVPVNDTACYSGYDNAGFIVGTSSSLFNEFLLELNSSGVEGVLYDAATAVLTGISSEDDDIAVYDPNPFYGVNPALSYMWNETELTLVDGGEDNQNVPLYPLIQPARNVDVIFASDNSADTDYNWPNGSSLVATYERQFVSIGNGTVFPSVPDTESFLGLGLTSQPTWFGCDSKNLTAKSPLIVYLANHPYSYYSNTSTFKMEYEEDEVAGMIENGYNAATQGNGTLNDDWQSCLACAIIHRETERRGVSPSSQCQACLDKYCWDGSVYNGTVTTAEFEPTVSIESAAAAMLLAARASTVAVAIGVLATFLVM
ncbi:lysophospholipase catalytic domain-containing protein [Dipodascopsis tothii]|uniref:lysophospholipase catalytic domain-containing protein n=1 Tax=Dipodascopsis tothii TaxID=44089 RepID=UPI0034CF294E